MQLPIMHLHVFCMYICNIMYVCILFLNLKVRQVNDANDQAE